MNRWVRLCAAVVAMVMIANLQYGWALFVKPIIAATGWKLSDVQWAFTFFIALETWAMPFCGFLIDKHGARGFMTLAGVLCGTGWIMIGHASTLTQLYGFYALAGLGAAMVYCGSIGVALKWFPDKRGLASGLIAAGFGSGSAPFIPLFSYLIRVSDYKTAMFYSGIGLGVVIIAAAQLLGNPAGGQTVAAPVLAAVKTKARAARQDFNSIEMLQTANFYVMYAMMLMMGIGGLMVTAQTVVVADSLHIGAAVVTLALSLNPIANGSGRLFWGWVSDSLGRERTMLIAFLLQSGALVGVMKIGPISPFWFVVSLAMVFFTWGEVYSLFPATCADTFGAKNASSNYSFLYSTKGVASIIGGGLAALLFEKLGSWNAVFYGSAVLAFLAALLSLVLRRMPLPTKAGADVPAASRVPVS